MAKSSGSVTKSEDAAVLSRQRWRKKMERAKQSKRAKRQRGLAGVVVGKPGLRPFKRPSIVKFTEETLGLSLSPAQRTLLKSIYGERLTKAEFEIFKRCTGRERYPGKRFYEVTVLAGARSGKDSRVATPIVAYEARFGRHERSLGQGEKARIVLVAQDKPGAGIALDYIKAAFERPSLSRRVVPDRGKSGQVRLKNGLIVQTFSSTKASTRGYSVPVAVLDEISFWRLEGSADSDIEIQTSIRRGMLSFPAPMLIKISTPYMKSGVLHDDFKTYFGTDSEDVLVWKSTTTEMNPTITEERLAREKRVMDSARFRREYEAEFSEDVSTFLDPAWIDNAVDAGVSQRPKIEGVMYTAAVDPSGGGPDAMTLCIVHREGDRVVQDVIKGWSRASAREGIAEEAADILKRYGLSRVSGDRYGLAWVREAFKRHKIDYVDARILKQGEQVYLDRSSAFLETEPLFASGLISLLDHPVQARELVNLERTPSQGGKDKVTHPRHKHDDYANALALAAAIASRQPAGRSLGSHVMVLERKMVGMREVSAYTKKRVERFLGPENHDDPRGFDKDREPSSVDRQPWGAGKRTWGQRPW